MQKSVKHKILMINHSSCKTGGSEDDFTRLLIKLKEKFEIISIFPKGDRCQLFKSLSDKYLVPPNRVLPIAKFSLKSYASFILYNFLRLFFLLPFLMKNRDVDLCYINSSVSFFDAFIVRLFGIPYIVSIKEKINPDFIGNHIYKYLNRTAEKIIVISDYLKQEFLRITGSDRAIIIYSSIESEYYLKIADEENKMSHKPDTNDIFIVLNIGNIYEIKGTDVILRAASRFSKDDNIKIKIIGESVSSEYQKYLDDLYNNLKLSDIVEFCGGIEKESLIKEIANSDCIAITSKVEGQSLVLLEALLLEKPVISTPVGVIPEVINDGINGLIYNFGDDEKLFKCIIKLKKDKELYNRIVSVSQKTFYDKFDLQKSLEKYVEEIDELILKKK